MLVSLHVKNLALIQETEVFFGPHLKPERENRLSSVPWVWPWEAAAIGI